MTRRDRLEAKLERLETWAARRRQAARATLTAGEAFRGDTAFNTQPGHIPFRARLVASEDRAHDSLRKAGSMAARAEGIAQQLDHTIFSDDDNAITALEARIAEREAKRDRMKRVNALYRKGDAIGLAALGLDLEQLRERVTTLESWNHMPYAGWEITNLSATIRADKERLTTVKAQQARAEQAEAAPSGVTVEGAEYVRVTFADKPGRATLDALKAAGFRWAGGSWLGYRTHLPEGIA